ncbi:MAG: hypothetical protein H6598_00780 [Flavobacteriales bacterium]|nr:hypothetical protein [Flavobacteriales bacterium]
MQEKIKGYSFFLIIGFIIIIILRWFNFDGLYGQDAHEYLRQGAVIKNALVNFSKPPDFYWAPGYPIILAIFDLPIGNMTLSAQIVGVLCWSSVLFYCWRFYQLYTKNSSTQQMFTVLALVGCAAYFFRVVFTDMSDGLTMVWISAAFYQLENARLNNKNISFFWSILFSGLAIFTRYAALPIVIIPIGWSLVSLIRVQSWKIIFLSILTSAFLSLCFFYLKDQNTTQITSQSIIKDWQLANLTKKEFINEQGKLSYYLPNWIYILYSFGHFGFVWLTIPIIIISKIKPLPTVIWWLMMSLLIYLIFLGGIPFQNKRFLAVTIPVVFMVLVPYLSQLTERIKNKVTWITIFLLIGFNISSSLYSFRVIYDLQQEELALTDALLEYSFNNLYAFDIDVALESRGVSAHFINLWQTEKLDFIEGDYFLINPEKWKNQWSEHLLMKNVTLILTDEHIILVDTFQNGWQLLKYE